jgi:pimeloyl-ACP methyl ester carboxylesterase
MRVAAVATLAALASIAAAIPVTEPFAVGKRAFEHNDFSCKSSSNPVVLLHGLGATYYEDLNYLEAYLQTKGYCTFSLTYGNYEGFPFVGGLKPIDESSQQIAEFVKYVQEKSGAAKIDLIGHSEGGFQALYTPKFHGIAGIVDKIVAIAPPTHGTDFAGLIKLVKLFGPDGREDIGEVLDKFGCPACNDLVVEGDAIRKLNDGKPIVQPGNTVTVITSKFDELVTPTTTSFIEEDGVHNIYVQDYCPFDPVGHIGEAYDLNVWNLVTNSLEGDVGDEFFCVIGSPGK